MQSTDGILKALNYSLFFLTYKWTGRCACLKTLRDLPDTPYKVVTETPEGEEDKVYPVYVKEPQPNGPDFPIQIHDLKDAVKMLGFYHYLDAKKSGHIKEMIKKETDWVDQIGTGKLPR